MNFNPDDVKKLAETILENPLYEKEYGRNAYLCCQYCSERYDWDYKGKFEHKQNCVVLIAQDVMTGLK